MNSTKTMTGGTSIQNSRRSVRKSRTAPPIAKNSGIQPSPQPNDHR